MLVGRLRSLASIQLGEVRIGPGGLPGTLHLLCLLPAANTPTHCCCDSEALCLSPLSHPLCPHLRWGVERGNESPLVTAPLAPAPAPPPSFVYSCSPNPDLGRGSGRVGGCQEVGLAVTGGQMIQEAVGDRAGISNLSRKGWGKKVF